MSLGKKQKKQKKNIKFKTMDGDESRKPSREALKKKQEKSKLLDSIGSYDELQKRYNKKWNLESSKTTQNLIKNSDNESLVPDCGKNDSLGELPLINKIKPENPSDCVASEDANNENLSESCKPVTDVGDGCCTSENSTTHLLDHNYCTALRIVGTKEYEATTLTFGNKFAGNEDEQRTIGDGKSVLKHVGPCVNTEYSLKKRISSDLDCAYDNPGKSLLSRSLRLRRHSSIESGRDGCASDGLRGRSNLVTHTKKSLLRGGVVSLDEIAKEISEMEKIIQSKCDMLCDKKKVPDNSGKGKSSERPSKSCRETGKDEDGDWNLEYTEDDVKNLGLDDLLLRASELNAENFTKALGQNTSGNGSKTDGSEFILTFPESVPKDGEASKPKKTKLDFYKTYVKENKTTKPDAEPQKATETIKCPGLKVKTVQNINEEFNDSLRKNRDEERGEGMKIRPEDGKDRPVVMTIIRNKDDPDTGAPEERLPEGKEENRGDVTLLLSRPFDVPKEDSGNNFRSEVKPKHGMDSVAYRKKNIAYPIGKKYLPMPTVGKKYLPASGEEVVVMTVDNAKKPYRKSNSPIKLPIDGDKNTFAEPPRDEVVAEEDRTAEESTWLEEARNEPQMISLGVFSNILKEILPDKWILSLDRRFGLQIIKTHLDELLNPSIMISVVVGWKGKVTVNVRGRQLENSHELFTNLCDMGNSKEKISINYILAIINKLRFFSVCFGCDDLSLKKYWSEDGFIEYYTEFQQTYRSHICELLVRFGKKRCYPCYRMHESLKKRRRRERMMKKTVLTPKGGKSEGYAGGRGAKRNLEEFLEESFITMKQRIEYEIERTREDEESEKVPKTQDEVLSFMGLTRKDALDVNLRKSKRERKGFKKCESVIGNNVNKEELFFLEKYWPDINVLFSTSLLIGAYSRTSTGRLREKCRMFHKLLSTWRGIVRDNPDWMGGFINLAENLVDDGEPLTEDSSREKFESMDVSTLRTYIINCVKEVNKIKSRLRTKNNYFKALYNTFVKPRMKKARQPSEDAKPETTKDLPKEPGNDNGADKPAEKGNGVENTVPDGD